MNDPHSVVHRAVRQQELIERIFIDPAGGGPSEGPVRRLCYFGDSEILTVTGV